MSEAARIVKRGGLTKLDAGKITEIIPPTPKQERLAEMWNKSTDPLIRWSRKATAIAEKANAPFVKFMGTVFMDVAAAGFCTEYHGVHDPDGEPVRFRGRAGNRYKGAGWLERKHDDQDFGPQCEGDGKYSQFRA